MHFGVLGPLEVVDEGQGEIRISGSVQRRVFTALLARCGEVVSVDSLLLAVWGDDAPATAERTLQSHIARLRDTLGRDGVGADLTFSGGGYRFEVDGHELDSALFTDAVTHARLLVGSDPRAALAHIEKGLGMWRGQPFADLAETDYPFAQAARLEELHQTARVERAEYLLAAGRNADAVAELEAVVTEHPFLEHGWELLMVGLYRQGRQADALTAYRRARKALDDELGVQPGPRLQEIEAQVLAQDPSLLGRLPAGPVARAPCPYKGLTRYDVGDSEFFVGRERLTEELVAALVDRPLVVVVGPSGAGKSSVVRAGLLTRLAEGAIPGADAWTVSVVVPDDQPLLRIQAALDDRPDLLVIDQAESAFSDRVPPAERMAIAELLSRSTAGLRVVLALRADFYGRLTEHPRLARLAGPSTVLVGPPSEEDLRRIIDEPARLAGLTVDPDVTAEIVRQISGHAGVLPVVSTALVRLWEHRDGDRLTLSGYRASGGVGAALERAGEDAWSDLVDDDQRSAARRILVRLAAYEDDRWVARRLSRDDLAPAADVAAVVAADVLCDRRLLVAHADSLEVAHEALFAGWPRLAGWLADAASSRREAERLAVAAKDWVAEGRDDALLLRGSRLVAATELEHVRPKDLAVLDHEFVEASVLAADREAVTERARTDAALRSRRRTRVIAGALAVALVGSLSAGVVAVHQARSANAAALAADAGRVGALAKDPTVPVDEALLLGAQGEALEPGPVEDSDLLAALARSSALVAAARSPSRVLSVAVSPDGRRVVTAGVEGQIVGWDSSTLKQESSFSGAPAAFVGVASGGQVVVGRQGPDPTVEVWSPTGDNLMTEHLPDFPAVAVDGDWFAFVTGSGRTLVQLRRASDPTTVVNAVRAPDSLSYLMACGPSDFCVVTDGGELRRVDIASATLSDPVDTRSALPAGAGAAAGDVVASPDGKEVAIGAGSNGLVQVRALPSGRLLRTLAEAPWQGTTLAFSQDGHWLAVYGSGVVQVWDIDAGQIVRTLTGHTGDVVTAAFSADGRRLYTGGLDRQVLEWDMAGDASFARTFSLDDPTEISTIWATDQVVVAGLAGGHVLFVNRRDGSISRPTKSSGAMDVDSARTGGDGTLLVVTNVDGRVSVWDTTTAEWLGDVPLPLPQLEPQTWVSPDGVTAATIRTSDGPLYVIDLATRSVHPVPMHLAPHSNPVLVLGWSADGRDVLLQSVTDQTGLDDVLFVDATTGEEVARVPVPGALFEAVADPSGRWIAAAGQDGNLRFIRISDGALLAPPQIAVDGLVYNVAISPDGRYVATGGQPGQVRLWDTSTFRQVGPDLPVPVGAATSRVRFARDGTLVVAFSANPDQSTVAKPGGAVTGQDLSHGNVIWTFPIGRTAWVQQACSVVGRPLTQDEWNTFLPQRAYEPSCS